jgi:Glycoside-hydrolase family GH114
MFSAIKQTQFQKRESMPAAHPNSSFYHQNEKQRNSAFLIFAALFLFGNVSRAAAVIVKDTATVATSWYRPSRLVNWQYQLSDNGNITYIPGVQLYIIDLDTARTQLKALKSRSPTAKVMCYFSAGTYEAFRANDDKKRGQYSISGSEWKGVLGKTLNGWPDERWLKITAPQVLSIMSRRMQFAKSIGCDGVDPDNVDGYSNNSGFVLTSADQIKYNKLLATTAHSLGLSIGLKNTVGLLKQLAADFDFFVNESCFTYNECDLYDAVGVEKPVLGVEYCNAKAEFGEPTQDPSCYCPRAAFNKWQFLVKEAELGAKRETCGHYCKRENCGVGTGSGNGSCASKKADVCPAFF